MTKLAEMLPEMEGRALARGLWDELQKIGAAQDQKGRYSTPLSGAGRGAALGGIVGLGHGLGRKQMAEQLQRIIQSGQVPKGLITKSLVRGVAGGAVAGATLGTLKMLKRKLQTKKSSAQRFLANLTSRG